jgi:hypothetical protein
MNQIGDGIVRASSKAEMLSGESRRTRWSRFVRGHWVGDVGEADMSHPRTKDPIAHNRPVMTQLSAGSFDRIFAGRTRRTRGSIVQ